MTHVRASCSAVFLACIARSCNARVFLAGVWDFVDMFQAGDKSPAMHAMLSCYELWLVQIRNDLTTQ
jgi:hypothetical protein